MRVFVTALMALALLATPSASVSVANASTQLALACPADAPDGWKRPGGFCDQINGLDTIGTEKGTGGPGNQGDCTHYTDRAPLTLDMLRGSLKVAGPAPCCLDGAISPLRNLPDGMLSRTDAYERFAGC